MFPLSTSGLTDRSSQRIHVDGVKMERRMDWNAIFGNASSLAMLGWAVLILAPRRIP
jgi:hypothetical protein